jgi:hypothetical protein
VLSSKLIPCRFKPHRAEWQDLSFLKREIESLGGFSPLMHLFPEETAEGLRIIPWGPLDIQIRHFVKTKTYKSTLIKSQGTVTMSTA